MTGATDLSQWSEYLRILAEADAVASLLSNPDDPAQLQDMHRLLFQSLSSGYLTTFADPGRPDFVPTISNVYNSVGANPDFIYAYACIDGAARYRLSGFRGDGLFLLFDVAAGWFSVMDEPGPSVGVLDIDTLTLGPGGSFDVLLSTERPVDHDGDWFPLDSRATAIHMRQASYDWGAGADARIAIERLNPAPPPPPPDPLYIQRRLKRLAAFPRRYVGFALQYCKDQRDKGLVNRFEHDDWAGRGGLTGQHYYQGMFSLPEGCALILETALPDSARYWNVQLNDPLWNTIDWFNHQSSLNGGQARIDPDGRFRAVISRDDPGVPNWLDPGGHSEGLLMIRWTEATSGPVPTLRSVPMSDIRSHLPASTPMVTPAMRQDSLRARRRGAQLRRRW